VIDVEIFTAPDAFTGTSRPAPSEDEVVRLCTIAASSTGLHDGHLAVEFVGSQRIAELNMSHRAKPEPTDVLSFPIDGTDALPAGSLRELGDVIICPAHTTDISEAIVHGVLHLIGLDHETDDGQMLALQSRLLGREPA
jgi:probable rRNA maturation factor